MSENLNQMSKLLNNLNAKNFIDLLEKIQEKIQENNKTLLKYENEKKLRKNEGWDSILFAINSEWNRDKILRLKKIKTIDINDKNKLISTIESICSKRELEILMINNDFIINNKVIKKEEIIIINEEQTIENEDNLIFFKVYNWSSNTNVDVGLMTINTTKNKAELEVYKYPHLGLMQSQSDDYCNFQKLENNIFIELQDKSDPSIKSYIIGFIPHNSELRDCKYIEGSFSSVGRSATSKHHPLAGLLLMEQVDSKEKNDRKSVQKAENDFSPAIFNHLYRTRLEVKFPISKLEDLEESTEVERVATSYVGIYQGYILQTSSDEKYLMSLILSIKSNTESIMYVKFPSTNAYNEYKGRIRITTELNSELVGYFDFKEKSRLYRFTVYLHRDKRQEKYLYGVYAGVENETSSVIAGRIRLELLRSDWEDKDISSFKNLIKNYKIEKFEIPEELKSDVDLNDLLFSSKVHPYDYLELISSDNLLKKIIFKFFGTYKIASLSTKQDRILICPMKIHENASVELKVQNNNTLYGTAFFDGNKRLGINFKKQNSENWIADYIFNISSIEDSQRVYFPGASSRLNTNFKPTGRVEVLIKENFDFSQSEFSSIKINTNEFKINNHQYHGLLHWLSGKYNRIAIAPKEIIDNTFDLKKREDEYVNIHFYAACYLAEQKKPEQALENLYKAYLHGFSDITLLNKEIKKWGKLNEIWKDRKTKVRPQYTNLDMLNCNEICNLIKTYNLSNR